MQHFRNLVPPNNLTCQKSPPNTYTLPLLAKQGVCIRASSPGTELGFYFRKINPIAKASAYRNSKALGTYQVDKLELGDRI